MKVGAKRAQPVPLTHMFAKRSCVGIFHNERTQSTPLEPKLMFWGVSDRFVTDMNPLGFVPDLSMRGVG
jgi:hypothetical protein